jgi:hypothetical protein
VLLSVDRRYCRPFGHRQLLSVDRVPGPPCHRSAS